MRIVHRIDCKDAARHLVSVTTTLASEAPLPSPLELFLAVWTPGSYLLREYARHVEGVSSEGGSVKKTAKNRWRVTHEGRHEVSISYRVYCNDLTVRTNHADATHVYLNGAPTFLCPVGAEYEPVTVEVDAPDGWEVATPLLPVPGDKRAFLAKSYDELVDSPLEIGEHRVASFDAAGIPHRFAIWPKSALSDEVIAALVRDSKTAIEAESKLMGGLPHAGYTFIFHVSPRGRGGLEHMTSSTLLAPEPSLGNREGWLDLLSLVAHEYFHLWNVKRMRPAGLFPYRYEEENYTRLLWWFEGGTSYFDYRFLRLAGLCKVDEYLDHLAGEIAYVEQTPGRLVHPLEEASFDAWIKLYRPDENSANSTVSYYRKGELVCAMLDVEIRARSAGKSSLDAVLVALWERFGKRNEPVPEDAMKRVFEEVSAVDLSDVWPKWITGASELDCAATFAKVGLSIERVTKGTASLAARLAGSGSRVNVASVSRGGAAHRAGIDPGDELLAIGGRRVESTSLDALLSGKNKGDRVEVLVTRDGRTRALTVELDGPKLDKVKLVPVANASTEAAMLRKAWLAE